MNTPTPEPLLWLTRLLEAEAIDKERIYRAAQSHSQIRRFIERRFAAIAAQINGPSSPRSGVRTSSRFEDEKQATVVSIHDTNSGRKVEFVVSFHDGFFNVIGATEGLRGKYRIYSFTALPNEEIEGIIVMDSEGTSHTMDDLIEGVITAFLFSPQIIRDAAELKPV